MFIQFASKFLSCRATVFVRPALFLFLSISSISCGHKLQLVETDRIVSLPSERGFDFCQGLEIGGYDYFVFTSFRTKKEVVLYNCHGEVYRRLSIDSLCRKEGIYLCDCYATPNKIILREVGENSVFEIDHNGELLNRYDYTYLSDVCGMKIHRPKLHQDSVLFMVTDSYRLNMGINPTEAVLWKANLKRGSEIEPLIDSFFCRFLDKGYTCSDYPIFTIADTSILIATAFCDTIYQYNLDGELVGLVPVDSRFFDAKIPSIPVERILDINETWMQNSWIEDIIYDPYRKVYYCVVNGSWKNERSRESDFSIIIYDSTLNPCAEQLFKGELYKSLCYVGRDGLYIMKRSSGNKLVFSLFKIQ